MNVSEAIRTRRAVRQFRADPVPDSTVRDILDAGRRSQSSKNRQPWQFIVVRHRETLQQLATTGDFAEHLAGAAFAVVLVGTVQTQWNSFDLGQAASLMQIAAWELGVGSCIAALHRTEQARAILGIPDDHNVFAAISFGYPAASHQPLKLGGRKPLDDIVRWEKW
jgi:nitroreductase